MRPVLDVAIRDLRSRLRDRSAWSMAFVAPLALAVILSLALGQSDGDVTISLAIADEDGAQVGALITGLARDLTGEVLDEIVGADDAAAVREAVEAGEVDAGIVVPAGTSATVTAGDPAEVTVVREGQGLAGTWLRRSPTERRRRSRKDGRPSISRFAPRPRRPRRPARSSCPSSKLSRCSRSSTIPSRDPGQRGELLRAGHGGQGRILAGSVAATVCRRASGRRSFRSPQQ